MTSDEDIIRTWDIIEDLAIKAPTEVKETEHGLDFINLNGDVCFTIFIAGTI